MASVAPDGSCLVFITTPMTYVQARAACTAMTAHLAYLKTAEIDTFAEQFIGTTDTWIGGTDLVTEGTFVWDDGSPRVFDNFAATEPNSGGGSYEEDCVLIAGARVTKQWDDRPCDPAALPGFGLYAYLCQFP